MIDFYVRFCARGVFRVVRRFDLQTTTGSLLAAAMLLVAVVPPGRIHAHASEEEVCDAGHSHSHGHFHDHHHASHHFDVARAGVRLATVTHIHLLVGPFEFSWPIHDEAEIVEDRFSGFRRCVDDLVLSPRSEAERTELPSPAEWCGPLTRSAVSLRQLTAPPDVAVLLCDVARRERSGVQLL